MKIFSKVLKKLLNLPAAFVAGLNNYWEKLCKKAKRSFCKKSLRGFTLVELLIAITIFVGFLVVVSNSYLSIIRSQKTANETRQMYSEMRNFVDFVNNEMREGTIDYFCYEGVSTSIDQDAGDAVRCAEKGNYVLDSGNNLRIISKDGLSASTVIFEKGQTENDNRIRVYKFTKKDNTWMPEIGYQGNDAGQSQVVGFSNLQVKDLHFEIYPKRDPASIDKQDLSNQIQPMALMTVHVASRNPVIDFNLNFQTMLTARSQ